MGSLRWLLVVAACGPTSVPGASDPSLGEDFSSSGVAAARLEQTLDGTIADSLSLACSDANGTTENSWYRVFSLRDAGIVDRIFEVNRVNFAVQTAYGQQRVQVSVGIYGGDPGAPTLDLSKIEMLAMTAVTVPPTTKGENLQATFAAAAIPANSNLIVEVHTPTHSQLGYFYVGATKAAETGPSYLRAPACNAPDPTAVSVLGHPETHVLIAVSGSY